jgi:hypothetical protein
MLSAITISLYSMSHNGDNKKVGLQIRSSALTPEVFCGLCKDTFLALASRYKNFEDRLQDFDFRRSYLCALEAGFNPVNYVPQEICIIYQRELCDIIKSLLPKEFTNTTSRDHVIVVPARHATISLSISKSQEPKPHFTFNAALSAFYKVQQHSCQ